MLRSRNCRDRSVHWACGTRIKADLCPLLPVCPSDAARLSTFSQCPVYAYLSWLIFFFPASAKQFVAIICISLEKDCPPHVSRISSLGLAFSTSSLSLLSLSSAVALMPLQRFHDLPRFRLHSHKSFQMARMSPPHLHHHISPLLRFVRPLGQFFRSSSVRFHACCDHLLSSPLLATM